MDSLRFKVTAEPYYIVDGTVYKLADEEAWPTPPVVGDIVEAVTSVIDEEGDRLVEFNGYEFHISSAVLEAA